MLALAGLFFSAIAGVEVLALATVGAVFPATSVFRAAGCGFFRPAASTLARPAWACRRHEFGLLAFDFGARNLSILDQRVDAGAGQPRTVGAHALAQAGRAYGMFRAVRVVVAMQPALLQPTWPAPVGTTPRSAAEARRNLRIPGLIDLLRTSIVSKPIIASSQGGTMAAKALEWQ